MKKKFLYRRRKENISDEYDEIMPNIFTNNILDKYYWEFVGFYNCSFGFIINTSGNSLTSVMKLVVTIFNVNLSLSTIFYVHALITVSDYQWYKLHLWKWYARNLLKHLNLFKTRQKKNKEIVLQNQTQTIRNKRVT